MKKVGHIAAADFFGSGQTSKQSAQENQNNGANYRDEQVHNQAVVFASITQLTGHEPTNQTAHNTQYYVDQYTVVGAHNPAGDVAGNPA